MPNQDLHCQVSTKAQPGTPHLNESGTPGLKNLEAAAGPNAEFGQAGDAAGFARNFDNFSPVTRFQQLQGQQRFIGSHRVARGLMASVKATLPVLDAPPITSSRLSDGVTMRWT